MLVIMLLCIIGVIIGFIFRNKAGYFLSIKYRSHYVHNFTHAETVINAVHRCLYVITVPKRYGQTDNILWHKRALRSIAR